MSTGIKGSGIKEITSFIANEVPKLKQLVQETRALGGVYAQKAGLLIGGLKAEIKEGIAEIDELEHFLNLSEGNGPEDAVNQVEAALSTSNIETPNSLNETVGGMALRKAEAERGRDDAAEKV
jgi:hypothetical protein